MLRLWISVPSIGTGADEDPYRPNLSPIADDVSGWSLGGDGDTEAIAYIVTYGKQSRTWFEARVTVLHGEDEQDARGYRARIPDVARNAVQDRAQALGISAIDMEHVDVNPSGLVG